MSSSKGVSQHNSRKNVRNGNAVAVDTAQHSAMRIFESCVTRRRAVACLNSTQRPCHAAGRRRAPRWLTSGSSHPCMHARIQQLGRHLAAQGERHQHRRLAQVLAQCSVRCDKGRYGLLDARAPWESAHSHFVASSCCTLALPLSDRNHAQTLRELSRTLANSRILRYSRIARMCHPASSIFLFLIVHVQEKMSDPGVGGFCKRMSCLFHQQREKRMSTWFGISFMLLSSFIRDQLQYLSCLVRNGFFVLFAFAGRPADITVLAVVAFPRHAAV